MFADMLTGFKPGELDEGLKSVQAIAKAHGIKIRIRDNRKWYRRAWDRLFGKKNKRRRVGLHVHTGELISVP